MGFSGPLAYSVSRIAPAPGWMVTRPPAAGTVTAAPAASGTAVCGRGPRTSHRSARRRARTGRSRPPVRSYGPGSGWGGPSGTSCVAGPDAPHIERRRDGGEVVRFEHGERVPRPRGQVLNLGFELADG